jgi:hypothetical protein
LIDVVNAFATYGFERKFTFVGIGPTPAKLRRIYESPVQQQIQQDYRSNLLGVQRDLLQSNPSGLGREQISIGHQLNGYDTTLH